MSIEKTLFAAADKMRGSMDAGEYKHIALGLLFLRYVSVSFQRLHDRLSKEDYSDPEDRDEYLAENIFWVPEKARWSSIESVNLSRSPPARWAASRDRVWPRKSQSTCEVA